MRVGHTAVIAAQVGVHVCNDKPVDAGYKVPSMLCGEGGIIVGCRGRRWKFMKELQNWKARLC